MLRSRCERWRLADGVAVVGAGTMGVGIAHVFAAHAIPTVLVDARPSCPRRRGRVPSSSSRASRRPGASRRRDRDGERDLTAAASIADAVDGADLIVEAVVERPDVKAAVYAAIEAAAADDAVIATNTSSIPIAELAAGLQHPERFLGMHWFVPPLLVPVRRGDPVGPRPTRTSSSRSSTR